MDVTDMVILTMLEKGKQDGRLPSMDEMAAKAGKAKSWIHRRVQRMIHVGLISGPRIPGGKRDIAITDLGVQYLKTSGFPATSLNDIFQRK